jgi:glycosidase
MLKVLKIVFYTTLSFLTLQGISQVTFHRVDPPSWWVDMQNPSLQLMFYGNEIAEANPVVNYPGVILKKTTRLENANYLILDLEIAKNTKPGTIPIVFEYQREILFTVDYQLKSRADGSRMRQGFDKEDVIYLIMPDRFSNGEPGNDSVPGMLEGANRLNPNGRHGGDIKGIREKVDYLSELGVTAIWLNPVLENNMPAYSYHGYAITDFYRVDPRFGSNDDYRGLVDDSHSKGLKVIMDMVFNHCGGNHFWIKDLPTDNWIHQFPEFTRSNFKAETAMDPYASDFDRDRMMTGWFDKPMPDLNQHNEILAEYLIQNSIWWVEFAGLDGIRMDTYPYSYKDFMANWMKRLLQEYPYFSVVGETWLQKESHTAFWQSESPVSGNYSSNLPCVTDFPLQYALKDAFVEQDGWTTGLSRLYYVLSQDFVYSDPFRNVIFADNHDLTRFYTSLKEDFNKFRMAMAVLLTTRGIPMIYYGTEYLMAGEESKGHGFIREDFPVGSWQLAVDSQQSAVGGQQSAVGGQQSAVGGVQGEAFEYMKTLLNWRKNAGVIHHGKLKQFVPQDGIYVYFRYLEDDAMMVVINKNKEIKNLDLKRFQEVLKDFNEGKDVASGEKFIFDNDLTIPVETALILELD